MCFRRNETSVWTSQQSELRDALHKIDPYLADLYEGAVLLLYACPVPGRARLIAHAVREIGNALPGKMADKSLPKRFDWTTELNSLVREWQNCGFSTDEAPSFPMDSGTRISGRDRPVEIPRSLFAELSGLTARYTKSLMNSEKKGKELFKACDSQNPAHIESLVPAIKQWLRVLKWFVDHVHDRMKSDEEILDAEFRDQFDNFETGLRSLTAEFFSTASDELDAILANANSSGEVPSPEQLGKTVLLLSRSANSFHFFETLENHYWIRPLCEKGSFKDPPQTLYDKSRGVTKFPPWPQSRYLARMASVAPHDVAEVVTNMPATDNISVREDVLRAALAMPVDSSLKLVDMAMTWAKEELLGDTVARKIGRLASRLATGGNMDEALRLTRSILNLQSKLRQRGVAEESADFDSSEEPSARFGTWEYKQILKDTIPHMVDATGLDTIEMLCDLLEGGLYVKESRRVRERCLDLSSMWRPAIEDHPQNLRDTKMDALIASLRDSAEQVCSRDPDAIDAVVRLLEKRQWPLFQRISLNLLCRFAQEVPSLVEERITDENLFDNHYVLHEYHHLCRAGFEYISLKAKERVLGWIEKGLDNEEVAKAIRSGGKEPTEQLICEIVDEWRLDKLAPMKGQLTGEWAEYYANLVDRMGEPQHPNFSFWFESKMGSDSPLTSQEMSTMPMTQILTFMRTWQPSTANLLAPSVRGLGHVLAQRVLLYPKAYAALADEFIDMVPTYVRSLLSGLKNAIGRGMQFDWKPVLTLCEWASQQPSVASGMPGTLETESREWGWTRDQIVDLLSMAMRSGRNTIPFELRTIVWSIIEPLTDDPDPPVDLDSADSDERNDPAMDSWNTTRGSAIHAVILYGRWVRENIENVCLMEDRKNQGFAIMPEVRSVLEAHLDIERDASPAIRSVFGQWLDPLVWLDKEWVSSKLGAIFPAAGQHDSLWRAAWDGYIMFNRYSREVFEMMCNEYRRAIASLAQVRDDYQLSDADRKLAEHLMTGYWLGDEALEFENSLVRQFFDKAPPELRQRALHLAGWWLYNHPGILPQNVVTRLTGLWEWRRHVIQQSDETGTLTGEAAQFGLWFASGRLDKQWAKQQLLFAVELCDRLDSEYRVVQRLVTLASQFPLDVADCFVALVANNANPQRVYHFHEEAFKALSIVIESGNTEAVKKAIEVANLFGEMGFRDFKVFVSPLTERT
jgi:hypothetical protein